MPSHFEVIQQLVDERDQLRDVIWRARPFLLYRLNPAAERIDGISRLRGEVDRLVQSWPEPVELEEDLHEVEEKESQSEDDLPTL